MNQGEKDFYKGWNSAIGTILALLPEWFAKPYPKELEPSDVVGRRTWRRELVKCELEKLRK